MLKATSRRVDEHGKEDDITCRVRAAASQGPRLDNLKKACICMLYVSITHTSE